MSRARQFTLRGLDPRVEREIRDLARRERISLNRAASRLLEEAAGLSSRPPQESGARAANRRAEADDQIGGDLDHLIGTWTASQAESFLKSIESCEQIDPAMWD